jgi:hypothetical protein
VLVLVLVLVLEWKRRSGLRRLHVGLVGIVTGLCLVPLYTKPSSTRTSAIWLSQRRAVASPNLCDLCGLAVKFFPSLVFLGALVVDPV